MSTRIISRAEGRIVPEGHTTATVTRPSQWLLLHHTGDTGWPKAGWSDAQHMGALQAYSSSVGKTWEYNYVITYPEGWIWEQAGAQQGAHCLNANGFSYGVQINQAVSRGRAGQKQVDSFRWLRAHLVETGQLAPNHQLVPHYGLRSTGCSAPDLSEPPGARRPSTPSGEGSFGSPWPEFFVPWVFSGPPPPDGSLIVTPEDKAYLDAKFAALPSLIVAQFLFGAEFPPHPNRPLKDWVLSLSDSAGAMMEALASIDPEELTAAVTEACAAALADATVTVDADAIATAVADELARRVAE
jgi:hypothetical protein